jgi:pimeloyl-ACP methyl ester carboxylesterase
MRANQGIRGPRPHAGNPWVRPHKIWKLASPLFIGALVGCSALPDRSLAPATKQLEQAQRLGWDANEQATDFVALRRPARSTYHYHTTYVFFEGDGRAWLNGGRSPPPDPTPRHSLALTLALETQPEHSAIYIGRACQFVLHVPQKQVHCPKEKWSTGRFAPAYIEAVIDYLRPHVSQGGRTIFLGHSGGGSVALLVAQTLRPNCVVTMASPIDTDRWTSTQGFDPLLGSLNPVKTLKRIPPENRIHYYGGLDKLVPSGSTVPTEEFDRVRVLGNIGHSRGWLELWRKIMEDPCH